MTIKQCVTPTINHNIDRITGICINCHRHKSKLGIEETANNANSVEAQSSHLYLSGFNVQGYAALTRVLQTAYDQCARYKGVERHANEEPFTNQPAMQIAKMVGPAGPVFQVMKKAQEAVGMIDRSEHDAAIEELKGVIIYAAIAILTIEEKRNAKD